MKHLLQAARYRLEYFAFLTYYFTLRLMTVQFASSLNGLVWRLIAPFTRRHGRAVNQLRVAFPDKSENECTAIAREMWYNLGCNFAEAMHLDTISQQQNAFISSNAELAVSLYTKKKKAVFVGLHVGNWELYGLNIADTKIPCVATYQKVANPLVDGFITRLRQPYYDHGILPKDASSARKLLELARKGVAICILADQRFFGGKEVKFFNQPAQANPFPARLAHSLECPLIAVRMRRIGSVKFILDCVEVPVSYSGDRETDIQTTCQAIHDQYENWIREYPAQWMWAHRKWG